MVRVLLRIAAAASSASPAAIVTISVPEKENIAPEVAMTTPLKPIGRKPPWPSRFSVPGAGVPGSRPATATRPTPMNRAITATFTQTTQNSISP